MFIFRVLILFMALTGELVAGTYGSDYNPELESLNSQEKIKYYLLRAAKEDDLNFSKGLIVIVV